MRLRSFPFRSLRSPFAPRVASLAAVSVLLVAAPARADECGDDADCGFGFACVTVVTSVASTGTGGVGGASGEGGAAGFAGGAAPRGGGAGVGVGGTTGTSGVGGTASPPTACGNRFCETPTESPETCPLDCAFTTICATAMCSSDSQCAPGYVCPTVGGLAAGGAGGVVFCGDLLCSVGETMATCDVDCAPNLRRCTPGYRYCASNADCALGYRCSFSGWLGTGGVSGEADVTGGTFTGGSSGAGGGSAGAGIGGGAGTGFAGGGALPSGGTSGEPPAGTCVPDTPSGGGVGGTSGTGAGGSTRGGDGGVSGTDNGAGEGDVVFTHGGCGCSFEKANDHSPFAMLVVGLAALLRLRRRRGAKSGGEHLA